jgi:hypothetical protein
MRPGRGSTGGVGGGTGWLGHDGTAPAGATGASGAAVDKGGDGGRGGGTIRRWRGCDWAGGAARSCRRRQATTAAGRETQRARENETARGAWPALKHFISDGYQPGRRT